MNKILVLLTGLVFIVTGIASAAPITITDTTIFNSEGTIDSEDYDDHGWGDVNKLDGILDHVTWTHYFSFTPPAAEILNGTLTLDLRDDAGKWDFWEIGFGWTESGEWDFGEVDTGSYEYDINLSFLADGEFQVTLGSLFGDFYIDQSQLKVTYNPVPEPSTLLLIGLGILGLTGVSRRKKS